MQWEDEGYLLSKINYNENSVIVDVFTLNHGKCSGIVYGGVSRKIKNYLQIGNKISLIFRSLGFSFAAVSISIRARPYCPDWYNDFDLPT